MIRTVDSCRMYDNSTVHTARAHFFTPIVCCMHTFFCLKRSVRLLCCAVLCATCVPWTELSLEGVMYNVMLLTSTFVSCEMHPVFSVGIQYGCEPLLSTPFPLLCRSVRVRFLFTVRKGRLKALAQLERDKLRYDVLTGIVQTMTKKYICTCSSCTIVCMLVCVRCRVYWLLAELCHTWIGLHRVLFSCCAVRTPFFDFFSFSVSCLFISFFEVPALADFTTFANAALDCIAARTFRVRSTKPLESGLVIVLIC